MDSFMGPNYSFTQTMMSELTPPGFEYMVGTARSASSRSQAPSAHKKQTNDSFSVYWTVESLRVNYWTECDPGDIDKKGNNWKAFPVLFVISALGCLVLFGVNVPKGRHAAAQWAAEKRGTGADAW
jgi:hypothetical protein